MAGKESSGRKFAHSKVSKEKIELICEPRKQTSEETNLVKLAIFLWL